MIKGKKTVRVITSVLLLSTFLCGCSETRDDGRDDTIELIAPVGVTEEYDYVSPRNMYIVDVYSSCVNPVVTEYAFSKEQTFKKYGATPGEVVDAGQVLAYSQTKDLDKETENIEEEIEDLESNHEIEVARLEKSLSEAKKNEEEAFESYHKIAIVEPEPCTVDHDIWENQVRWPEYSYKRSVQNRERIEEETKQNKELYDLEHEYKLQSKQRVLDKVRDTTVVTNKAGEVVACNYFANGDVISKDTPILAVGDTNSKILQTEYITKATIAKALDYYAIINGRRYDIEYIPMEPEEYKQLVDEDETVRTSFILSNGAEDIPIGSYATIVVESDRRKKVLCLPISALNKESDGYYVYKYSDEGTSYVPVEIGMKDGMYAEVISGLEEGDKVVSSDNPKIGKNTATITKGDYAIDAEFSGFLYYPFSEWMTNPSQNGTTYLKELLVTENETVVAGQALATIEVVADDIEIERLNTQISRLQKRLNDMTATKEAAALKDIVSYDLNIKISEHERDIKLKKRELSKISKYAGIIEIKAPYDGVITQVSTMKPGDILSTDEKIVEIADANMSYIIVKDEKKQLNYGNIAQITASGVNGPVTIEGKVVTINGNSLSKNLTNDYALVKISEEDKENIVGTVMIDMGRWDRNNFKVKVSIRSQKGVLMVPKAAVTLKDKSTYVNVVNNDGSIERVSFIPGGSDTNNYWIAYGLSEGMTVCWE